MRKYLLPYFPSIPQHLNRVLPWTWCSINIYWMINEKWMFQNWNNIPYEEGIKISSHAFTYWVVLTQTCSLCDYHLSSIFTFKVLLLCILHIYEVLKYAMFHYDSDCLISSVIQKRKKKSTISRQKANIQKKWNSKSTLVKVIFCEKKQFSLVAQSCPTLWCHELQHARPPCSSPTPGVYSNSCLSSQWCHPAISSSVIPSSSCSQSLPASGSFPMSQLFTLGSQSIGLSISASVLPMNTQDWSPLGWIGWISLSPRDSQEPSQHHSSKGSILRCSAFFTVQLSHPYMTTGKTIALTRRTLLAK